MNSNTFANNVNIINFTLQMTREIQLVPDDNSLKCLSPRLTACLQGCSVYPPSYNKHSTPESARNPEKSLSQTLGINRNLTICFGFSRAVRKKIMTNYKVNSILYVMYPEHFALHCTCTIRYFLDRSTGFSVSSQLV